MWRAIDEMLTLLTVTRWPQREQCKVTRLPQGLTFQRGGMQAAAMELDGGLIEVTYEHADHEVTRHRCTPMQAAQLVRLVFQRQRLCKVETVQ